MSFKENLLKKIQINQLARKVLAAARGFPVDRTARHARALRQWRHASGLDFAIVDQLDWRPRLASAAHGAAACTEPLR